MHNKKNIGLGTKFSPPADLWYKLLIKIIGVNDLKKILIIFIFILNIEDRPKSKVMICSLNLPNCERLGDFLQVIIPKIWCSQNSAISSIKPSTSLPSKIINLSSKINQNQPKFLERQQFLLFGNIQIRKLI